MKFSAKLEAPAELADWLALANDDWQPAYEDLRGAEKRVTHESLLREQGFVCCYCGASLPENRDDSHIEHFRPQSRFPEDALDYRNMFASCGPPKATAVPQTCGANKAAWYDAANHVIPSDPDCEQRFAYGLDGSISAAIPDDAGAKNMVRVLNLKAEHLSLERAQIVAAIEAAIAIGEITGATKASEIALWRSRDARGRLKGFGHVAGRYLEDEPIA